jgi:hypothetical protein
MDELRDALPFALSMDRGVDDLLVRRLIPAMLHVPLEQYIPLLLFPHPLHPSASD